jgi:spermidine synthase
VRKKTVPLPEDAMIAPSLRRYLYFTAAVTGAAIMIIEILGAKMLAPFLGTSHFVWTAQIAITLVALAGGYYVGGRLVDYSRKLSLLYGAILVAAVYLALTSLIVEPMAYWCLREFKLPLGSLLTSTFLFFIPLALLAMTGPFLVRVLTSSVQNVGGNIGRLTAISTLGSFLGTILISYVLVPFLPNATTMFITSSSLMALMVGYFFVWEIRSRNKPIVVIGILAGTLLGYGGMQKTSIHESSGVVELYRANSNFGLLQVLQNPGATQRFYLNDYLTQNTYDPAEKKSTAMFTYMLRDLALAYTPRVERALCIGMGVGIVPTEFARRGIKVDVIEINPAVLPVASNYFHCEIGKMNVTIGDGRYFVNQSTNHYDTIVLDAFLGDSSPSHLMTKEAFSGMRRLLGSEGTLVINSFGEFDARKDFFTSSLHKTLGAVFKSVHIHAAENGNVFFVASEQADLKILHLPDFEEVHSICRHRVQQAFAGTRQTNPLHGIVLTDNYNPAEYYDAANREQIRRYLALSMRDL